MSRASLNLFSQFIVLMLVCFNAHAQEQPLQSQVLNPPTLQLDDPNMLKTQQLLLRFAEPIAIAGALPSGEQVAAILVEGEQFPGCRWRFVGTSALACDLPYPLPINSEFVMRIDDDFSALGRSLNKPVHFKLSTPIPTADILIEELDILSISHNRNDAVVSLGMLNVTDEMAKMNTEYASWTTWYELLSGHLRLLLPSGEEVPFSGSVEEEHGYENWVAKLELSGYGDFQLILPAGTMLPNSNLPLADHLVIEEFTQAEYFEWLGYRCISGRYEMKPSTPQPWSKNSVLDCPAGALELRFSHPIEVSRHNQDLPNTRVGEELKRVDWLSNYAGFIHPYTANRNGVVSLVLQPNQEFELDVAALWQENYAEKGKVKPPRVGKISLRTITMFNDWWPLFDTDTIPYSPDPMTELLETRDDRGLSVAVRSVSELTMKLDTVTSADSLLAWLNGKHESFKWNWKLPEQSESNVYQMPIQQWAPDGGVVIVDGPHEVIGTGRENILLRVSDQVVQYDTFLLRTFGNAQPMIVAWEWSGEPIANVDIFYVCEGMEITYFIGSTDESGTLSSEGITSQEIQAESSCWLWGTADGRHASFTLNNSIDEYSAMVASMTLAQDTLRRQDKLNVTVEALSRHNQSLNDDLLKLELVREGVRRRVALSKLTASGLATASFEFSADMPFGSYHLELSYDDQIVSRSNEIELKEFIPPTSRLEGSLIVNMVDSSKVSVSGVANSVSQVAIVDQLIEHELDVVSAESIYSANSWPKNWEYHFSIESQPELKEVNLRSESRTDTNGAFTFEWNNPHKNKHVQVSWQATATMPNGERQEIWDQRIIYGLSAYPALQEYMDGSFRVRLISANGTWIKQDFRVDIWSRNGEQQEFLKSCRADHGIADCNLPSGERFELRVVTDKHVFGKYIARQVERQEDDITIQIAKRVELGNELPLTIVSSQEKKAVLWLVTDRLIESRVINLNKGSQEIVLQPKVEWGNAVTVALGYWDEDDLQLKERDVRVVPRLDQLEVSLRLAQSQLIDQSSQTITIESNLDADVQIWLLDESALVGRYASAPKIDRIRTLDGRAWQPPLSYWNRYRETTVTEIESGLYGWLTWPIASEEDYIVTERIAVTGSAMTGAMGFDVDSSGSENDVDQRLVLWQPMLQLSAGKPKQVVIELPARATQWRVFAIAASGQQRRISYHRFNYLSTVEVSAHAATLSYEGDQLQLGVTANNRSDKPHRQTVEVILNEDVVGQVEFDLRGQQHQRKVLALPELPIGSHRLILRSNDGRQNQLLELEVLNRWRKQQEALWVEEPGTFLWQLPKIAKEVNFRVRSVQDIDFEMAIQQRREFSWPQKLNRALVLVTEPVEKQTNDTKDDISQLLGSYIWIDNRFRRYEYFTAVDDDWVTAYSFLMLHRMSMESLGGAAKSLLNSLDSEVVLKDIVTTSDDVSARALALFSLYKLHKPSWEDFQSLAAELLVDENTKTALLYFVSMHAYPEADTLRRSMQRQIQNSGYQLNSGRLFDDALSHCLAIHAFSDNTALRMQSYVQLNTLLERSDDTSLGLCMLVLNDVDELETSISPSASIAAVMQSELGRWEVNIDQPEQTVIADYLIALDQQPASAQGLSLSRSYKAFRKGEWKTLSRGSRLDVGELVEVTLTVNSPSELRDATLVDYLPGGWTLEGKYGTGFDWCWWKCSYQHQSNQVEFFLGFVDKGDTVFKYQAVVRSSGTFLTPGAELSVANIDELKARTEVTYWKVH